MEALLEVPALLELALGLLALIKTSKKLDAMDFWLKLVFSPCLTIKPLSYGQREMPMGVVGLADASAPALAAELVPLPDMERA